MLFTSCSFAHFSFFCQVRLLWYCFFGILLLVADVVVTRTRMAGQTDRRTRRISSQRYDPSQDQVVPQLGNRSGDKDERDPHNLTLAPSAPVN
uniref:Uncharacterized protein n=1 Tax=Rhizophora mucronata TaxID=61149 RepID=A0A2P2KX10_RHIMU